jgi:hypothetical protein
MLQLERERVGRGAYLNKASADNTAMNYSESVGGIKKLEMVLKIGTSSATPSEDKINE